MKKPSFNTFKKYILNSSQSYFKSSSTQKEYLEAMFQDTEEIIRKCYNDSSAGLSFKKDFLELLFQFKKNNHKGISDYTYLNLYDFFSLSSVLCDFTYSHNLDLEKGSHLLKDEVVCVYEATELDLGFPYYNIDESKNKVINKGETDRYSSNLPIYIGRLRSILDKLEKEKATRVTIFYHPDHHGYYFTGSRITHPDNEEE